MKKNKYGPCWPSFCLIKMEWRTWIEDLTCYLYQKTNHLDLYFQRRNFFNIQPIRNKNCPQCPCCFFVSRQMKKIFVEDFTNIIPVKFVSNWTCSFRENNQNVNNLWTDYQWWQKLAWPQWVRGAKNTHKTNYQNLHYILF